MESVRGLLRIEGNPSILAFCNNLAVKLASSLFVFGESTAVVVKDYLDRHGVLESLDIAVEKLNEHPILGFGLLACAAVCTIPIFTFLFIGIASIFIGFLTFLLIEGIFLLISFIVFVPCLVAVFLLMVFVAACFTVFYIATFTLAKAFLAARKTTAPFVTEPPVDD